MKTTIKLCKQCDKEFTKPSSYFRKKLKARKNKDENYFFCSSVCAMRYRHEHNIGMDGLKAGYKSRTLTRDQYSPFRPILRQTRMRSNHENNLTLDYLKKLWEIQSGTCPYTRVVMLLPETTQDYYKIRHPLKASIDRIDLSKGYIEGNIQFVPLSINLAKNNFTEEEFVELFINKIIPR